RPAVRAERHAAAARGECGRRSQADQRGGVPRLLPAGGRDRSKGHGLRAAGRAAALRPAEGETAARRSRISRRVRCRGIHRDSRLSDGGRSGGKRPERGGDSRQGGAGGGPRGLSRPARKESGRACPCRRPENPASRVEAFIQSKGAYAYGGYPDIDNLFEQQARERDPEQREALLHRIQQLTIDRVMYAPVMDLRVLMGVGPRIAKHTITDVWMSPFPSYEDIELKH